MSDEIDSMRFRSGNVQYDSNLVSFLYTLMRDYITPGEVEECIKICTHSEVSYTNGWLAKYAKDIADRLK